MHVSRPDHEAHGRCPQGSLDTAYTHGSCPCERRKAAEAERARIVAIIDAAMPADELWNKAGVLNAITKGGE